MIKSILTNEILKHILAIDQNKLKTGTVNIPINISNTLRKNSKKKSAYSSNKIEGNPLTEIQSNSVIESDAHKHFLKPEQEIRNYFEALEFLEKKLEQNTPFTKKLILETQALVEKGSSKEKIGLRGPMPPGVLFAVYDSETGNPDYIPPEYSDIPGLLDELIEYLNTTDDNPLIVAAIIHYQLVTIHPFEDGNGRTARLMSGYYLDKNGYSFNKIGSLEEYFSYDIQEYYDSLQMGLPALYYSGRNNPPNPEIWINYFLRMVELYSNKVYQLAESTNQESILNSLSYLSVKEKNFLNNLIEKKVYTFSPTEAGNLFGISNRTVINYCSQLVKNGFLIPNIAKERILSYTLTEFAKSIKTINALFSYDKTSKGTSKSGRK